MSTLTNALEVASDAEIVNRPPNTEAQNLLNKFRADGHEKVVEDIEARGMGYSLASIKIYFEELRDVHEAQRRIEKIDADLMTLEEKESIKRSEQLGAEKRLSLKILIGGENIQ